jgi:hypothetical protein
MRSPSQLKKPGGSLIAVKRIMKSSPPENTYSILTKEMGRSSVIVIILGPLIGNKRS